jgi:plasmid segregation protein ParM
LAAYFDLTLDAAGELQSSNVNTMAVIDIGGSTTDIAVILEGDTIDQGRLGSLKLGVLDVHAEIQRLFDKKFERMEYPSKVMERAIRFKKIKLHGVDHDVSALVDEAITTVSYRLKNEIGIILGNTALLDKVFFVGGGAAVFNDIAAGWHNASVAENPGFANARGLFKYSLRPA